MGIDIVLLLIDGPGLAALVHRPTQEVHALMAAGGLRGLRPAPVPALDRRFDIDLEAEWLDWYEAEVGPGGEAPLLELLSERVGGASLGLEQAADGLLLLAHWMSGGAWEAWEGRARLYAEALLGAELDHIEWLDEPATWLDVGRRLTAMGPDEAAEVVVLDWMRRREALGETLDELRDPHILPTMQRHQAASSRLHAAFVAAETSTGSHWVLGREHLPAHQWGWQDWTFADLLTGRRGLEVWT